ncbi:uncharacterized protein [Rutidosis leptorrhynchoides]|uniref:uncharacterized protein n=1 Tax=Rutidosis leptorrhynchoides TaxID=125765 RepID=UPI003A98DAF8
MEALGQKYGGFWAKCGGFWAKWGVRQGDPLSPFLFILVAEGLHVLTKLAVRNNLFVGVEVGNNMVPISHLQYADDTIFFEKWCESNLKNLMLILKCFELTSGLKVNYQKSSLYGVCVEKSTIDEMARYFRCKAGSFPFTYLGIPVGGKMNRIECWAPVINKFEKRLSDWKARSMSDLEGSSHGSSISFWDDVWLGEKTLKERFNRIARLETNQAAIVQDRLQLIGSEVYPVWNWSREPSVRAVGELSSLISLLGSIKMNPSRPDSWEWVGNSKKTFTTKDLTKLINEETLCVGPNALKTLKNYLIPKKVEVFIWRARKRRLPVRMELDKRGIDLDSVRCPLCDNDVETVDHSLVSCKNVEEIWSRIYAWWGAGTISNHSLDELLVYGAMQQGSDSGKLIWQAVVWICCYLI